MSRRRLSDEERALWKGFARAVTPLRGEASGDEPGISSHQAPKTAMSRTASRPEPAKPKQPPSLGQFDRRLRQRVGRGQTAINARLDLHGMTQKQAHAALLNFLQQAQANDAKLALVVTGKGLAVPRPQRANAAYYDDKSHYGCRCRSSAALSSVSNRRMSATAAKARFTCACGGASVSPPMPAHSHLLTLTSRKPEKTHELVKFVGETPRRSKLRVGRVKHVRECRHESQFRVRFQFDPQRRFRSAHARRSRKMDGDDPRDQPRAAGRAEDLGNELKRPTGRPRRDYSAHKINRLRSTFLARSPTCLCT